MISNKYYVTTIIAIFLALSIGILIGGTLGQQWLNFNQQKLIMHYEQKSKDLEKRNHELKNEKNEINKNYQNIRKELYALYTRSIANLLQDKHFLFISTVSQDYNNFFNAIKLAGGNITEIDFNMVINEEKLTYEINNDFYDAIILFVNNKENEEYKRFLNKEIPIIYINENQEVRLNDKQTTLKQMINTDSYTDYYGLIYYLRNILEVKLER